jgi:hypothetical protein
MHGWWGNTVLEGSHSASVVELLSLVILAYAIQTETLVDGD